MQDNQKTIFVLDHTQYFGISSEDYIPLEFLKGKSNAADAAASPQFSKSLWTCSVESSIEYCRIVWDLFPRGKLVRFIVSDTAAHIVNTWNLSTQNMSHVLNAMALVGVPQRAMSQTSDFSVIHGLRAAIEALAEPTDFQLMAMQQSGGKASNRGRVICITSARDNPSMKSLEDIFHTVLMQQNSVIAAQKKMLPIDHCHLVIINMVPLNMETLVTNRGILELSPTLSTEIHTTSAPDISNKLTHLIMSHYNLASTTVTGIPMKEEQNANSSANYDVEILHALNAHTSICGNEALLPTSIKEGSQYSTVTLKWCTPRTSDIQHNLCVAQHRVTPVDVTSRPSACLINFLLNGRAVLLEMPRKTGGKITSHLLSARGGEIFIHALQITRSCLEDMPSIGDGRAVSEYRLNDFAAFIKQHRFVPLKTKAKLGENLQRGRDRIMRRTRYFPLTMNTSLVFNLQRNLTWLAYLLRKIIKEDIDKSDEVQCQQYIFELYTAASRGDILPFVNLNPARIKGQKKIDQYRLVCTELETLVRLYNTTPHHKVIIESIQNVKSAWSESKGDSESLRKSIIRATTDSPLSPPHPMDVTSSSSGSSSHKSMRRSGHSTRNLLDMFATAERCQTAKRSDFTGRIVTPHGQVAKLYPDFGKDANGSAAGKEAGKEDTAALKSEPTGPALRT